MKNLVCRFIILYFLFFGVCFANVEQQNAYKNDYLYSEEYFDYLIECAEREKMELEEQQKLELKNKKENNEISQNLEEEITPNQDDIKEDFISSDFEPFKLRVVEDVDVSPYSEKYKTIDSKTIISVGSKINFIQNLVTSRNKYNSNDYKILAGTEINPCKYIIISTGLETNYRGIDQIPSSRKLYFSPGIQINDIFSLTFHNKINLSSSATDHDIGFKISPFKSKAFDFGVYAGVTRTQAGDLSESINFTTNFKFF